jgi:hypothetical protein
MNGQELWARVRAYIAEHTAAPTDVIDAVLEAEQRFWREHYPHLQDAAIAMLAEADERDAG